MEPLSLYQITGVVVGAFYTEFDEIPQGIEYWVHDVYQGYLVAFAYHEDRQAYRVEYSFDEPTRETTFQTKEDWTPVHWEWVEDERSAAEERKREMGFPSIEAEQTVQERSAVEVNEAPAVTEAAERDVHVASFYATPRMSRDGSTTTFMITTNVPARDGLIVDPDGLEIAPFLTNPIVQWQHGRDPKRGAMPIGKCIALTRSGSGWVGKVEWYNDDFSQNIKRMVKDGFLQAASIRWRTLERGTAEYGGRTYPADLRSELLEFSVVSVPADSLALVTERSEQYERTIETLREEIQSLSESIRTLAEPGATAPAAREETAEPPTGDPAADAPPDAREDAPTADRAVDRLSAKEPPAPVHLSPDAMRSLVEGLVPAIDRAVSVKIDRITGRA